MWCEYSFLLLDTKETNQGKIKAGGSPSKKSDFVSKMRGLSTRI